MDFDHYIAPNFTNDLIKEIIGQNHTIGLKFKKSFKSSICIFIHFLLTYAEEIANERGLNKINNQIINEALMEIDFGDIIEKVVKEQAEEKERKNLVKRNLQAIDN